MTIVYFAGAVLSALFGVILASSQMHKPKMDWLLFGMELCLIVIGVSSLVLAVHP